MDLVVSCNRFPQAGETAFGTDFGMYPGGKGANQAVAVARAGGKVHFVTRMGDDGFRAELVKSLASNGIGSDHVLTDPSESTGIALITVDRSGQNQILVVSGSNMRLSPEDLEERRSLFEQVDVVLLQLEIPIGTVVRAAEMASDAGAQVVLNPAPAQQLPDQIYPALDFITPNETEAEQLTGTPVSDRKSAEQAADWFFQKGVTNVVFTLGERGALLVTHDRTKLFAAPRVDPLDTTAAGDAFNGALAARLAEGSPIDDALEFANAFAALSVTRAGAQPSMPAYREAMEFMSTHSNSLKP